MSGVEITFLEVRERSERPPATPPSEGLSILRAERPTVSFYRYLHDTVGEPWKWYERREMTDSELTEIVTDPKVEVFVLYKSGVPAGYVELDWRVANEVQIAYFGLMPEFIGRGFGPYLLDWAVDHSWKQNPARIWVHTCPLDHPSALATYERAGFRQYQP